LGDKQVEIELWNGHAVRFVEENGEYKAIAKDITDALGIENVSQAVAPLIAEGWVCKTYIPHPQSPKRKKLEVTVLSELGIYRLIMRSNKPEALEFQKWVYSQLKSLREALGYEQYRIMTFTESVKNHHLNMDIIKEALNPKDKVPYVKAHAIANKCMANIVGEPKAISKDELIDRYPDMLSLRDEVLSATSELMAVNEKYGLGLSVSKKIYEKYAATGVTA
jgi:prophage antirepressor-like protein